VPSGRQPGERGIDVHQEGAEVTLHRIELGGEVADVPHLDLLRRDACLLEPAEHRLAHHRRDVLAFLGPVPREVGLVTAENVDRSSHVCPHA
jgi:hypothetical protein